jgi:hypothetical protein
MVSFKYLKNIKSFFKHHFESLENLFEILVNVVCYGFVLNLIALAFFGFELDFIKVISFGFVWYFISAELPIVFEKYRGR